jgi:glycosyltransferase involved in cell wall biosynthesis
MEDASHDGTLGLAQKVACEDDRIVIRSNGDRLGALANIIRGFQALSCQPEDVCLVLDGDDWLGNRKALEWLWNVYRDGKIQLTYGQFRVLSDGRLGQALPFPDEVRQARSYRKYNGPVGFGQLRTFRHKLWSRVDEEDLIDPETGKPWEMAWDVAMMLPMLEMCGPGAIVCMKKVLYTYNDMNPLSDFRTDGRKQLELEGRIRARPSYVGR